MTLPPSPQDPGTPNPGAPWPAQTPGTPPAAPWPGAAQPPAAPVPLTQPGTAQTPIPPVSPAPPVSPTQPGTQPGGAPFQPSAVVPPAGYPAAPGSPVVAPGAPSAGATLPWWISGIPKQAWLRTALLTGIALGAGLIAALVTALLAITQAPETPAALSRIVGAPDVAGQWFPATIQLLGMGYLGILGGKVSAENSYFTIEGGVSLFFVVLIVPLASWAALRWLAPRLGTPVTAPHWAPRAVLSAAAGLGSAIIVTLLTALIPIGASGAPVSVALRSASSLGFIGAWAIIGTLVYFSLRPRGSGPWGQIVRDAAATALWHLWTLGLLLAVIALIYLCVKAKSGEPLLAIPLIVPTLGTALFQLSHLIPFGAAGSALPDLGDDSTASYSLFSDGVPGWVWPIALVLALVWLVLASARWRVRRGLPGTNPLEWVALPAVYLLLGLALLIVDRLAIGTSLGVTGAQSMALAPAGWGFLVLVLVGLAIEALSRYVAIPLLRALPAGLRGVLSLGLPAAPSAPLPAPAPRAAAAASTWGTPGGPGAQPAAGFPALTGYPTPGTTTPAPGYAPAAAPGSSPAAQQPPAVQGGQGAAPDAAAPWAPAPPQPWAQAPAGPAAPSASAGPAAPGPAAPAPVSPAPIPPTAAWGSAPPAPPAPPAAGVPDAGLSAPSAATAHVPIQDPGHPPIAPVPSPEEEAALRLDPPASAPIPESAPEAAWASSAPPAVTPPAPDAAPAAPAEPTAVEQEDVEAPAEPQAPAEAAGHEGDSAPGSAPLGGWTRPPREPGSGPRH